MITRRQWLTASVILTLGMLQVWDSNVFAASAVVAVMAVAAVAIPAGAALVTNRSAIHGAAIAVTAALVLTARLISPIPLPELALVIVIAALPLFLFAAIVHAGRATRASR